MVKVDGALAGPLAATGEPCPGLEAAGYHGRMDRRSQRHPFLPHVLAAEHTKSLELGTAIAVAFARSPMTLAHTAWDLQGSPAGGSSSASARRSSRTSRSGSRCRGAIRRRGCAS